MHRCTRIFLQSVVTLSCAALVACGGSDDNGSSTSTPTTPTTSTKSLADACPGFVPANLPHGAAVTKTEIKAGKGTLPDVCMLHGQIVSSSASTIKWAVELPEPSKWNQKTLTIGGGGFDGFIPTDDDWYQALPGTSANPYVKISSDSGHQSRGFEWAVDDVALRNHAFDANHFVLEVGTEIASQFYGKRPTRRYMIGQSNGGRAGIVSAQRYPKDYDGVIALEPAISQQGHEANNIVINRQFFSDPANWLSPAKIALYAKAETDACDSLDGLKDGIIGNIEQCKYVPTNLLCTGADSDSCLTAGQIESIRLIYADKAVPVALADGYMGYPRYSRGGAATSDWASFMFGSSFAARDSFNYFVGDEAAKVVTNNPSIDYMTYDPTQFQSNWTRLSTLIDATNPDVSAFAGNGGKMLIWYGTADSCVSMYRLVEYFNSVKAKLGESKVRSFARLVTSPSIGHDMDGPGPNYIDFVAAIDDWVERGVAPDNLVSSKLEKGSTAPKFQRPVCEYPKFPRWDGVGDATQASSFVCSAT